MSVLKRWQNIEDCFAETLNIYVTQPRATFGFELTSAANLRTTFAVTTSLMARNHKWVPKLDVERTIPKTETVYQHHFEAVVHSRTY